MGLFSRKKKRAPSELPPPPPPGGNLPPLPSMELEAPPQPSMPVPEAPMPLPDFDSEPVLEEVPSDKEYVIHEKENVPRVPLPPEPDFDIPTITADALPTPEEVESHYDSPVLAPDSTLKVPPLMEDVEKVDHWFDREEHVPSAADFGVQEKKAYKKVAPQARKKHVPALRMPRGAPEQLFVSVEDYSSMHESLEIINSKMQESEALVEHVASIKDKEEKLLEEWRSHLEHIEKKLAYVDHIIFEGE